MSLRTVGSGTIIRHASSTIYTAFMVVGGNPWTADPRYHILHFLPFADCVGRGKRGWVTIRYGVLSILVLLE